MKPTWLTKINQTINPIISKKTKSIGSNLGWHKMLDFTFDSPPKSSTVFNVVGKKCTLMTFELSVPQGTINLVISLSDAFVSSDYQPQTFHSHSEKEFNQGGKIVIIIKYSCSSLHGAMMIVSYLFLMMRVKYCYHLTISFRMPQRSIWTTSRRSLRSCPPVWMLT